MSWLLLWHHTWLISCGELCISQFHPGQAAIIVFWTFIAKKMKQREVCCCLLVFTLSCARKGLTTYRSDEFSSPKCSDQQAERHANEWSKPQIAESRQLNTPTPAAYIRAAVYVRWQEKTPLEERDRLERILLFGGWETVDPYENVSQPRGTWIYTLIENSWFRVPLKVQPPDRFGHSLTAVCRNIVALYGGILNADVSYGAHMWYFSAGKLPPPVSDLWIFDGVREKWQKIITEVSPPPRSFHSAVAFESGSRSGDRACFCQHSIIIFGGLTRDENSNSSKLLDDLWELQCIGLGSREPMCRWRRHQERPVWPVGRYFHFAVSVGNATMLMFGGKLGSNSNKTNLNDTSLWSLNVSSGEWNQIYCSQLQEQCPNAQGAEVHYTTFVVDAVKNRTLRIHAGKLYLLKQQSFTWVKERVLVGRSTPVNMSDFAAVSINGTIIAFAGIEPHSSFRRMRVWQVEMINDNWIWQLLSAPRTSPPLQELASWNVIDDRLIFAASTSHEWAVYLCHQWSRFIDVFNAACERLLRFPRILEIVKSFTNRFNNMRNGMDTTTNSVWQMDIATYTWWQYSTDTNNRPLVYTASTGISYRESKILVTYGGSSVAEFNNLTSSSISPFSLALNKSEVFFYFLKDRLWIKPRLQDPGHDRPEARIFATLTHIGDGHSMILFGGAAVNVETVEKLLNSSPPSEVVTLYQQAKSSMTNEVWQLTMSANWSSSPPNNITIRWTKLTTHTPDETVPEGRVGHSALVVENKLLVIWGGLHLPSTSEIRKHYLRHLQILECAKELWVLDLHQLTWKRHKPIAIVSECWNPSNLCRASATILGSTIVSTYHPTSGLENETRCNLPRVLSIRVTEANCDIWFRHPYPFRFKPEFMFSWNDQVLAFSQELGNEVREGQSEMTLNFKYQDRIYTSQMTLGCEAGFNSSNWGRTLCRECNRYSFAPPGSHNCTPCPKGLFRNNTRAASINDCICDPRYCRHGRCFIAHADREISAECQCDFGFTGVRCQHATYFIITAFSIASFLIFLLLLVFMRQMMKYKKQKAAKQTALEEMSRVWTIKPSEIVLLHRIDDCAPGSYGDVYKARYRDMTVALKKLKLRTREFDREFQRETELMKSMRHENIALFLGAGTFGSDDCPFLVVEYMRKGALSCILRNTDITVTQQQEINFCLDAAKGMEFLHSQRPPRIHRDLKSGNLLVSARWVVKVADFGSARLVKSLGARQLVAKHKPTYRDATNKDTQPLLKAEGKLSDSVGSALWRAPEIFSDEPYGTSADVYSFGIVMWEIVARDEPYRAMGYRWMREIKEAVLAKVRPALPRGVAKTYRDLMRKCWSADPSRRPAFSEVVQRLTQMSAHGYGEVQTQVVGSSP